MFQEEEPGKPQNWCYTITVILIISLINVAIFVVLRVLLDTENEFDEPIIQGKLREDLTQFLGIFALTFCFGCWCCFCCTGNCFRCCAYLNPKKWKFGTLWANFIGEQFTRTRTRMKQTLRRKHPKEEHLDMDDFSGPCKNGGSRISRKNSSKMEDFERGVSSSNSSENSAENGEKPRERPTTLGMEAPPKKLSRQEKTQFGVERVRRWSIAPVSSDVLVKMSEGKKPPIGKQRNRAESVVAVRGIDFLQIPVQMMTPSTVAIVDKGKLNQAYEGADEASPSSAAQEKFPSREREI